MKLSVKLLVKLSVKLSVKLPMKTQTREGRSHRLFCLLGRPSLTHSTLDVIKKALPRVRPSALREVTATIPHVLLLTSLHRRFVGATWAVWRR